MRTVFLFAVLSISVSVQAQKFSWYTAEGKDYYQVSQCRPGSEAAFYSSVNGGRHLRSDVIGEGGAVTVLASKTFRPHMVLNTGNRGNKHVAFTGPREFAIASPAVRGSDNTATITWSGAAADNKDISFGLLRSTDGIHYQAVHNTDVRSGDDVAPYSYTEAWTGAAVLYKIAVMSNSAGLRYTTQPMLLTGISGITVFPTSVTDHLFIALPALADGAGYTIVNSEGKKVDEGGLYSIQSPVSFDRFASGTYIVTVHCGAEQKATKVVKM